MKRVLIVPTGVANLASVTTALLRCGAQPASATTAGAVAEADYVVLPGVGAFGAGTAALSAHGFRDALRDRIAAGRPTLAICLGMQLLGRASAESPDVPGLGATEATAVPFPRSVRVPQMGWNRVSAPPDDPWLPGGYAYFANSYCFRAAPDGWRPAWADYAGPLVAAMTRGGVLACQFHPELSGAWGLALIRSWLETQVREPVAC